MEDQENFLHFIRVSLYVVVVSVFLGGAVLVSIAQISVANFIGAGLFLGQKKKNGAAILKGMYELAHGYRLGDQFSAAEKTYQNTGRLPRRTRRPLLPGKGHIGKLLSTINVTSSLAR